MTNRERFQAVMSFRPFDRLPVIEWAGWWTQTLDRWRREGLPAELTDRYAICRHFGLDIYRQDWFRAVPSEAPQPARHGAGILADEVGYEKLLPILYRIREDRPVNPAVWQSWAAEQQRGESVLWFTVEGFFWFPRRLLGIERHLYAFYDQPDLVHRINADLADWILKVVERVCDICAPDFMTFAEDMSYNHGAMLSEELFNEFMLPYYRRVVPHIRKKGVIPLVDSDGDITVPAAWFRRAGIEGILPLERQAGVDIGRLRALYPDLKWIGHFDKMTMNKGEGAMRAEFERLLPVAARGGFIVGCDHQTPPGVSLADYRLYLSLFREYAAEAGRRSATGA